MKDASYMTSSSAFVTHGRRKNADRARIRGPRAFPRKRDRRAPTRCQAVLAIQWLWSLSTDESQVIAALFSGLVRFQSLTSRL
jgi:hypothetical protein